MTAETSAGTAGRLRVLVYEDARLSRPDSRHAHAPPSWLWATCAGLAGAGCAVTALLKTPAPPGTEPVDDLPGVAVRRPYEERMLDQLATGGLSRGQAAWLLRRLDRQEDFDVVVVNGIDVAGRALDKGGFRGRLWTHLHGDADAESWTQVPARLVRVTQSSNRVLCPTEDLRSWLEYSLPDCVGRFLIAPGLDSGGTNMPAGEAVSARWAAHLARALPRPRLPADRAARPLRLAVAGHDLKFAWTMIRHLESVPGLEVRIDKWSTLTDHDPVTSLEVAEWADVVLCEWAGHNAVWYSRHKRAGQRILVRFHRFEIDRPWLTDIRIDAVDAVVCVSEHTARSVTERTGWPREKVVVIPNVVDVHQLDRPKLPGAAFHLGLIGIVPSLKRVDLALDVLEALRRRDERFLLRIKSRMPWEYAWVWRQRSEREHYTGIFRRIATSPWLRDAVVFDEAGPDVAAYLRTVGFVLSTSDLESFHLAPAEGMASRAVPAFRCRAGVAEIFPDRWIHPDAPAMADAIAGTVAAGRWAEQGQQAHNYVAEHFDLDRVATAWLARLVDASG